MICNIGEVMQHDTTFFNAHFQYSQSKIMGLNKVRSLKSLGYIRMWYLNQSTCNTYISDSQALFWCFVLIILRMAGQDTLF